MGGRSWKTYRDFVIKIGRLGAGLYRVEAEGPTGEAESTFSLPFDEKDLTIFLLQVNQPRRVFSRGRVPQPMQPTVDFGSRLYNAVLSGAVRDLFVASRQSSNQKGVGLRLRLRLLDVPELTDLPWEFLYDGREFLALSDDTPLVHYLDLPNPPRPLKVELPLRILVTVSAPRDLPPLDVQQERARIETALAGLVKQGQLELDFSPDASLKSLQRTLRNARSNGQPYHVWHFIGHGAFDPATQTGTLALCGENDFSSPANGFQLGTLFGSYPELRLVILNSCEGARTGQADPFSSVAAVLVERGIPAVIGMQFEISDQAAIAFSEEFYAALVDGLPIDSALTEARRAVFFLPNWVEWATPILYMRSPNGVLFNIQPRAILERLEAERLAREKAGEERLAAEKVDQERLAALEAEKERIAREKEEAERLAAQKDEEERLAAEKAKAERAERLRQAIDRVELERIKREEGEQLAAQKAEEERQAQEKEQAEHLAAERVQQSFERVESERIRREQEERLAAQKAEEERLAQEKKQAERLAWEKVQTEKAAREEAGQATAIHPATGGFPRKGKVWIAVAALLGLGVILPGLLWLQNPYFWPLIVVSLGVLLLVIGILTRASVMAVPACIIIGIGGLFFWQNLGFTWDSWAYAWTFIPAFVGCGILLRNLLDGKIRRGLLLGGWWLILSVVLFIISLIIMRVVATHTPNPTNPLVVISPTNAHKVAQLARWDKGTIYAVSWSPDGKLLAGVSSTKIYLYDAQTHKQVRFIQTNDRVECTTFSPDGQTLASGLNDDTVRLWQVSDGTLLRTLEGFIGGADSVAFSPDGQTLASGSADNTVRLWQVSDGALLRPLEGNTDWVNSVAFSPDGKTLATGSVLNNVQLWQVSDGAMLRTLEGHTDPVESVAFSPDGQTLASGSLDKTIRLWRVSDGAMLFTLEGHTHYVFSVAFSPDGQTLASGSADNTVRLWRVSDGSLLRTLEGHTRSVTSLAFSPDGQTLASWSGLEGTLRLWGVIP